MVNVRIVNKFLTPNPYSRPQDKITKVKGIVVHWTASPRGNNIGVWNYFERRKSGTNGYGSAHYIVSLEGIIWNCIPTNEIAYHVGSKTYTSKALNKLGSYPNLTTIGIEFCIVDNEGKMNEATWREGAKLIAHLLNKFNLGKEDIWLHYDVVGWKDCHRYFVNNPNEYERFKNDVMNYKNETNTSTGTTAPTNNTINNKEIHVVVLGDTLWSIARKYNITVEKLKDLNQNKDLSPLQIGQELVVKEFVGTTYQVVAGDTLWGIAMKFNTTVEKLKQINPNIDVYALQVGEYIKVSESTTTSSPTSTPTNYENILPNKILRFGDIGEDVKKLQNALNKLYFNVGYADGSFGVKTQDALKRYQSMYFGLVPNGIFNETTREKMLEDLLK